MSETHFVLPYEPDFTGHRGDAEKHQETLAWLRARETMIDRSPSIVPKREPAPARERA